MIYNTVNLCDLYAGLSDLGGKPMLTAYCRSNSREVETERRYPAMLILPGGGYSFTSDREAEPIALKYLEAGFNCFVLRYSVAPAKYPSALLQAAAAVDYIRKTADETMTQCDQIAVIGFSAGGHLAGTLSDFWSEPFVAQTLGTASENVRPNAAILAYPVISGGPKAHRGSFDCLCGGDDALVSRLSLENAVNRNTPPTFVWHTATDGCVPVENSLMYCTALQANGIPFALHIFHRGGHGLSTCGYQTAKLVDGTGGSIEPAVSEWFPLSVTWLKDTFSRKFL